MLDNCSWKIICGHLNKGSRPIVCILRWIMPPSILYQVFAPHGAATGVVEAANAFLQFPVRTTSVREKLTQVRHQNTSRVGPL